MSLLSHVASWPVLGPERERLEAEYLLYACAALRRNEPTMAHIYTFDDKWPNGWIRPLGEAILYNTVVTDLELSMLWALPREAGDIQAAAVAAEPLLQYLRSSPSLRNITLCEDSNGAAVADPVLHWLCRKILTAIAESQRIEELHVDMALPMQEFVDFLSDTRTLRLLDLDVQYFISGGDDSRLGTIQALQANQSLETLRLLAHDEHASSWIEEVLEPLASHPKLQCLDFVGGDDSDSIPKTLPLVLQQSATLKQVSFDRYIVGKKSWKKWIEALKLNSSVQRLIFKRCRFGSKKAITRFIQSFQATRKSSDNDTDSHQSFVDVSWRGRFRGEETADVLAQIWKGPVAPGRTHQKGHFFLRLSSLFVNCCDLYDVAQHLPHSTHLRALSTVESRNTRDRFCSCNDNRNRDALLRAVQCNGSLHSVTVERNPDRANTGESERPLLGERRLRLIEAYCERNRLAPQLLAKRLDIQDEDQSNEQQDAAALGHAQIFPPVFVSMYPAWKMAPTTLLIGLTAAADPATIGFNYEAA